MNFSEKLQLIRTSRGITQEKLAEKLQVSRQAVTKWEGGQAYPDISNLIALSNLFYVTVDYLVRDADCEKSAVSHADEDWPEVIDFRTEAARNTYAGFGTESDPSRPHSHDYRYERGDYAYIDTYLGGERFSGEEAVWKKGEPVWAMNYTGRVLDERFSGDFLKEALRMCSPDAPYRGPKFYQAGDYVYQSKTAGTMDWFQGYEEIDYRNEKVYECYYHGGSIK